MSAANVLNRNRRAGTCLALCYISFSFESGILSHFCFGVWHQLLNSVSFGLQFVASNILTGGRSGRRPWKRHCLDVCLSAAWGTEDLFCWFCLLHAEISPDSLNLLMTLWAVEGKSWWSSSSRCCPLLPVNPQPGALRTPQHSQPLVASASSCLYLEYAYIYKSELRWRDRLCRLCAVFIWTECRKRTITWSHPVFIRVFLNVPTFFCVFGTWCMSGPGSSGIVQAGSHCHCLLGHLNIMG